MGVEDGCEAGLFSPPLSIIAGSDHTTTRESCVNKMWPVRLGIGTTPGPRRERFAPGVQVLAFPVSSLCEPFSLSLSVSSSIVATLHFQFGQPLHVAKEAVRDHLVKGGTIEEGKEMGVLGFALEVAIAMFIQTPEPNSVWLIFFRCKL